MIHLRLLQDITLGKKTYRAGSLMALSDTGRALADELLAQAKAEVYRPDRRLLRVMDDAVKGAGCCGS